MKVAIVYDRANKWGGAERLLLALQEIFTNAQLFTSVHSEDNINWTSNFSKITTSTISKLSHIRDKHEYLGTVMPIIFECFDFSSFDLVISVTSEAAKGVITGPGTKHICICLTPTRYLWSHYDVYFKNRVLRLVSKPAVGYLRKWDRVAAQRPDVMVAISRDVQKRIKKYYGRDSVLIHPPLMLKAKGEKSKEQKHRGNYFLVVSRLVPYKSVDLVVETFNTMGLPLVIVGTGSEEEKLKKLASANIKFVKNLSDWELASYYRDAKALIFPQVEDFGLVAVEAMSFGTPVIAYKKGGILDIVKEGLNGVFFLEQNAFSLSRAVKAFHNLQFNSRIISRDARRFSKQKFKRELFEIVNKL